MRITKHTDFALRVLIFLASRPGERVSTERIAQAHGISLAHLQKVVRRLGELGFLRLVRGSGGGVELARDPEDVSIGAVVRALDDATSLVECFEPATDTCVISSACRLKGSLRVAQEAFYAALDDTNLQEIVAGKVGARLRELTGG
ncbi:RrF2 family transcriptional regulator [Engelhardtia mirabilis]|uniref:HTH-type transcriptional repressor NsrR n=1 Tax=Engelhardtia mirabilis TaxID=2528011 RepID=A0A518BSM6_9BACT|nr:HTH-type transcriptional repressor NsrR [Planctomycetes bacterium Pla133]QDV04293.1 HTH-type transcriptional repressor NsrR [Planctomycetes bacterium Pla86]